MAGGGPISSGGSNSNFDSSKNYTPAISLVAGLFFMIGFITVLNDVLIPTMKEIFQFKDDETWKLMLIQFCFFFAYGIMSVPGGAIIKKIGYKNGTVLSVVLVVIGLLLFYPASEYAIYGLFLSALFVIGLGFAIMQVAINPYLVALGSPETGASRLNLGGALNSTATFIGPILGAWMLLNECSKGTERLGLLQNSYLIFAGLFVLVAVVLLMMKLPKISIENEEGDELKESIFSFSHLLYGSGAIFFYVGAEVVIGSLLVVYLRSDVMGSIPEKLATTMVAYYWGGAMIGRFAGSALTRKIAPNKALAFVSAMAFILIGLSMVPVLLETSVSVPTIDVGNHCESGDFYMGLTSVQLPLAGLCLISIGLFNSIMWPSIFPLGISKLGKYTSKGSGLMVTMVAGGAFVSLFQGFLADKIGYTYSFVTCLVCYAYIFFFAIKGYKVKKSGEKL